MWAEFSATLLEEAKQDVMDRWRTYDDLAKAPSPEAIAAPANIPAPAAK